ncbi:hypothetical protein GALMADRAFT_281581 [Galerina marginata CBS 339.88]|uniref:F-box domain-containing protein n=1 Tax=Galerina marginata (strain CBS 339.88) TaxID=685588 RepID=A0A067SWI2_GALM3|nr:hypothetical protein GALMADRAFT_281581 [Galerina marginata CBS 339.88]
MSRSEIPLDIIQNVLENLDNSNDADSLKALALSCKSVLPLSQSRLFYSISLPKNYSCQLKTILYDERLAQILRGSPYICAYVRSFEHIMDEDRDTSTVGFIISQLKHLQRLHLMHRGDPFNWNLLGFEDIDYTSAVYAAFRLPGFTHLRLSSVMNFPITEFTNKCKTLSVVELAAFHIGMARLEGNGHVLATPPPQAPRIRTYEANNLVSGRMVNRVNNMRCLYSTSPYFDFRSLKKLSVVWFCPPYVSITKVIVDHTQGLECLRIRLVDRTKDATFSGLSAVICGSCIGTLTQLTVAFLAEAAKVTSTLCKELERIVVAPNVLKQITIMLIFDAPYQCYPDLDLKRLDSIISTEFSNLETVTIALEVKEEHIRRFKDANVIERFRQKFLQVNNVNKPKFACILQSR